MKQRLPRKLKKKTKLILQELNEFLRVASNYADEFINKYAENETKETSENSELK